MNSNSNNLTITTIAIKQIVESLCEDDQLCAREKERTKAKIHVSCKALILRLGYFCTLLCAYRPCKYVILWILAVIGRVSL